MIISLREYIEQGGNFEDLSIEANKPIFNFHDSMYCGLPILEWNIHPNSKEHVEMVLDWESRDHNKDIQYRTNCCNITWISICPDGEVV